ncbi:MAG: hypothetical protein V3T25_05910 [Gemmatimonadota bacterium]
MMPRELLRLRTLLLPGAFLLVIATGARAQDVGKWCDESYDDDEGRYCEVREQTLPATGSVTVDAGPNGGVAVTGGNRNDVKVEAKVHARAKTQARARQIAQEVSILADGGTIRAEGPKAGEDESWAVSFRLSVPARTDLSLETLNGGIGIEGVSGDLEFRAVNGGVSLVDVSGYVSGSTTNGGLSIELTGDEWEGEGLDVKTTNGGVNLQIPEGYSARLETGTVNGRLEIGFPVTVQGRLDKMLTTELGSGGKLIRARTTNGGVKISRG